MDIDLLGRTSNQIENLRFIISEIAKIPCLEDAVIFDTEKLNFRITQTTGDYHGVSSSFFAKLFTTKMLVQIDIGFNDLIIPEPQKIKYPTLLGMPEPSILGYTLETVIAEKLEAIVKLAMINTRMKDFFDIWMILNQHEISHDSLKNAITKVFANRGTTLKYPIAFTPRYYESKTTQLQWKNFLSSMGKDQINFKDVVMELSKKLNPYFL